jgi:hypothetical protein
MKKATTNSCDMQSIEEGLAAVIGGGRNPYGRGYVELLGFQMSFIWIDQ